MKRYFLAALVFYLGLSNGHLAIRKDSAAEPICVLPYSAELFPEADRQALKQGIPFSSRSDLTKLLEDYLS